MSNWIGELDSIIKDVGLRYTFSINCHSGITHLLGPDHKCGCKRCMTERGQQWDETTEAQAADDSKRAQVKMREWAKEMNKKGAL